LVIDDEPAVVEVLAGDLRRAGMKVESATDGAAGLECARASQFDAIVLDLNLPDMSGTEVLKQMRFYGDNTPVAVLTGYPTVESAFEVGTWAATSYLKKPLFGDAFVAAVREVAGSGAHDARPLGVDPRAGSPADRAIRSLRRLMSTSFDRRAAARLDVLLGEALRELGAVAADPASTLPVFLTACRGFRRLRTAVAAEVPREAVEAERRLSMAISSALPDDVRVRELVDQLSAKGPRAVMTTKAIALEWAVTPDAVTRLLRRQTLVNLAGLKLALRCRSSLQALARTDEQVAQIAYSAGYEHPTRLDHDLRRLLAVSPSAFRRTLRAGP
jgi:CheY-like chemotaxis protein